MGKFHIVCFTKRLIYIIIVLTFIAVAASITFFKLLNISVNNYLDSSERTIVLDAGHGGIDGGTSKDGVLEKDVNLDIVKRIKTYLEGIGYNVILTRDADKSLDSLISGNGSRHLKDLRARTNIINNSNALFFLSIHGNCHTKNLSADGSIVLYNERFTQNKTLAYSIQSALNNIMIDGKKRTVHNPQNKSSFYLLNYSKIPGIIIETVFISNQKERELITQDKFKDEISRAIVDGIEMYLNQNLRVNGVKK